MREVVLSKLQIPQPSSITGLNDQGLNETRQPDRNLLGKKAIVQAMRSTGRPAILPALPPGRRATDCPLCEGVVISNKTIPDRTLIDPKA